MPCYPCYDKDRKRIGFICGDLGKQCPECGDVADYQCDYPVGKIKRVIDGFAVFMQTKLLLTFIIALLTMKSGKNL
jgi:hypothetical protein